MPIVFIVSVYVMTTALACNLSLIAFLLGDL